MIIIIDQIFFAKRKLTKELKRKRVKLPIKAKIVEVPKKIMIARKERGKQNKHAPLEKVERQQDEFVNSEVEGSMIMHRGNFKKRQWEFSVNFKKRRIPAKKSSHRDKLYGI